MPLPPLHALIETRTVIIGVGAISSVASAYSGCFGSRPALIIADENTWAAAGQAVQEQLAASGSVIPPLVLPGQPVLHAEMGNVERVQAAISASEAIPIAVGSGTINDLVKLASHRCGRPYMVVGTAASMDGYTAFGSSITFRGSKQTFDCPAPRALVADMNVIAAAPPEMASTGYADLIAKIPGGADWILADALGIEPINQKAWGLVQSSLLQRLAGADRVRCGDRQALENLLRGLVDSGLAMQVTQSSRPASGAEHQFSHLWDMQGLRLHGQVVPHGSKVGIGTMAMCAMYEAMLELPLDQLDVDTLCARWPSFEQVLIRLTQLHDVPAIREKAIAETRIKYISAAQLRARLLRLRSVWPNLRERLQSQLLTAAQVRGMLSMAGAPVEPREIGLAPNQLRDSFHLAQSIRRRYTVLDLANETGYFDTIVNRMYPL